MHDDLTQRLLFAEHDFLTALQNGPQSLASFHQTLSTLQNVLSTAAKTGSVGDETLSLGHVVASRILNLASCFLDILRVEEISRAQLQNDCNAMIYQMSALDLNGRSKSPHLDNSAPRRTPPTRLNTPISNTEGSSPFLTSAYQWLLDNLHNPYPTMEVKTRIAAASSCQVSSVNSWFTNTRRRIGWTTLCRERFSNCRADMLDAAYRALVEEDPQRALPPALRHSFNAMKVAAENLYSSTFTRSAFAGDLDTIVKDITEENRESIGVGKHSQVHKSDLVKVQETGTCRGSLVSERDNLQAAQGSYPSPDSSTIVSPVPALDGSFTDESEEDVAPPIIASSKRRRSSMEPVDPPSSAASRPIKRLRASKAPQTCFPSPPLSTGGSSEPSDDSSPEPEACKALSRRQRLSEADATGILKRPRDSTAVRRVHTVSNSLPRPNLENEYSIDDWFDTNFDALFAIPPPVDATEPDFSASWEVELFKDYSIPGNLKYVPKYPLAPIVDTHIPTNLYELDGLLQSIGGNTLIPPFDSVPPFDIDGASHTPSLDPSTRCISQPNIDWTSLLNGTETYQPTICAAFPQQPTDSLPLPEIDLSMLQLPHIMPAAHSQGEFALKRAKLDQLHAMQEAVRRMEQELQSEGVLM